MSDLTKIRTSFIGSHDDYLLLLSSSYWLGCVFIYKLKKRVKWIEKNESSEYRQLNHVSENKGFCGIMWKIILVVNFYFGCEDNSVSLENKLWGFFFVRHIWLP